uniref:PiggyBac transposable element-derived protein domain-containing protein n=1 Tax=Schistosoma haematobium TaxID=6185 RepID=A0A094ZY47_SCHHA
MIIVANWIIKAPVTLVAAFADVTETPAVQWYEYCRDICALKMTRLHESFGGVGSIVEIDETVVRERKYNRGRSIKEDWLSSTSVNILDRYLEFMIAQRKRGISRG